MMQGDKPKYPECKLTPDMLWEFRREILGGKSAVTGSELPKALDECNQGVQEDHYAQACYVHATTQLTTEQLLNEGTNLLLAVPCPKVIPVGRCLELRQAAKVRVLLDHGVG